MVRRANGKVRADRERRVIGLPLYERRLVGVASHYQSRPPAVASCLSRQGYANVMRPTNMAARKRESSTPPGFTLTHGKRVLPVLQTGTGCVVALRALGEDTRLRIVGLLLESPLDVGGIAQRLGVSQYNVSKHLRILREAGLLERQKNGRTCRYALPDDLQRSGEADRVLDLGCCSFQFERGPSRPKSRRPRVLND